MKIQSPDFKNGDFMPERLSYYGGGERPVLAISDVPQNAVELAIIVDDPDAPGGTFRHWAVANIDPATTAIEKDKLPSEAVELINGRQVNGYIPPRPPSGTHRYIFKLYALSKKSEATKNLTATDLEKIIEPNIIDRSELLGLYKRS